MGSTIVDRLYLEFQEIVDNLDQTELSLRVAAEQILQKSLLVAAASHFEHEVKSQITNLVMKQDGGNELILEFLRNKAIERQYHTYFQWRGNNANSFFGLFGEGFKAHMTKRVKTDRDYEEAISAFLELERERNRLVHEDFGNFPLEKTSEEIFDLYRKASLFVTSIETSFSEYLRSSSQTESIGEGRETKPSTTN